MTATDQRQAPARAQDQNSPGALARARSGLARALPGMPGRLALAAASGAVLFASFPPRTLWWLAPLAFAGLAVTLLGARARAGAAYGLVFGLVFNLAHLHWIQSFLGQDFGPWPWLGLSLVMALFVAAAAAGMALVSKLLAAPVWMAALYVAQEWLRSMWPMNGFPWGRVAFGQPDGTFAPLAALGGAPLVSFAVVLSGVAAGWLAVIALARLRRGPGGHGTPRRALPGRAPGGESTPRRRLLRRSAPAALLVVPLAAGLASAPMLSTAASAGTADVAVVQGNAPNVGLDLMGTREVIRANHLAESERLLADIDRGAAPRPDLLVWPETATEVAGSDATLDALVDQFDAPALIGAMHRLPGDSAAGGGPAGDGPASDPAGSDPAASDPAASDVVENSVLQWQPGEGAVAGYAKQELVPFAERVPLRPLARWFTPFADSLQEMRPGSQPGVFDAGGITAGVAICYEVAYDRVLRETVSGGAELLVIPTNNAWYGHSEMSHQQLAMSRMRAIEHGRSAVVAATSGISAIVSPDGQARQSSELFTADSLSAEVPLRDSTTVATVVGDWPERAMLLAGLGALLTVAWQRRRARSLPR